MIKKKGIDKNFYKLYGGLFIVDDIAIVIAFYGIIITFSSFIGGNVGYALGNDNVVGKTIITGIGMTTFSLFGVILGTMVYIPYFWIYNIALFGGIVLGILSSVIGLLGAVIMTPVVAIATGVGTFLAIISAPIWGTLLTYAGPPIVSNGLKFIGTITPYLISGGVSLSVIFIVHTWHYGMDFIMNLVMAIIITGSKIQKMTTDTISMLSISKKFYKKGIYYKGDIDLLEKEIIQNKNLIPDDIDNQISSVIDIFIAWTLVFIPRETKANDILLSLKTSTIGGHLSDKDYLYIYKIFYNFMKMIPLELGQSMGNKEFITGIFNVLTNCVSGLLTLINKETKTEISNPLLTVCQNVATFTDDIVFYFINSIPIIIISLKVKTLQSNKIQNNKVTVNNSQSSKFEIINDDDLNEIE